ncbi:Concanavalin A-like lectin/glucanases superfamily protein [Streptomyces sp. yr375]|uniref:LamG-like jellyroll fold domain-containing protein n=1 Tax=Streptomyces sp. yr375 TaxID=1761906 RepID=UPI0008CB43B3|nr:LamG-like jellyroll fold domain-containing protein [Streptomyces sp. yr375]SER01274.1 Concanavalin A-like lectin/glucanases superfamily protein [Streptomyces sp. yr375]
MTPSEASSATADAADLSPEAAASRKAAESGSPVEVSAETTPTQLVTAQPDGTFTVDFDPTPVRVKKASGWVPVDTDLATTSSGDVVPKAAAVDVAFSGGGSRDPLAAITQDGKTYSVGSPWTLPVPKLSGSTATYSDVMPGTDLVVQATPDGFSENLVVKSRDAAQNEKLSSIAFPVSADGVSAHDTQAGGAAFVDDQGRPVFTTGTALMYDSSAIATAPQATGSATALKASYVVGAAASGQAEASGDGALDGPAPGSKSQVMDVTVSDDALTLKPDRSFLDDPDTTYPVVLDPQTTSASLSGWTTVWSSSPSTSFWKTSHSLGVGYDAWVDNKKARSLYQFDTHTLGGKKILSATFTALEVWSANCTAKAVQLWRTGAISASTKWSAQPSWAAQVDSVTAAKGYSSSCPGGNVSFDATSAVTYTAGQSSSTTTLGLRAPGNEDDAFAWKQFASPSDTKPTLSVTFVSKPSAPTGVKTSSPSLACAAGLGTAAVIRDTTPTVTAAPKSADGSQSTLRPNFELYRYDAKVGDPLIASGNPSAYTASGTAGTWTTPALTNGQTYWFRARSQYKYTFNGTTGFMYSAWSPACWFRIDSSAPVQPDVDSTTYQECASPETPDDCTAYGGVGAAAAFTLKANGASDVVKYTYQLNDNPVRTKTFTTATTSYALSLVPDVRGVNTLTVQTWDSAGNVSASYTYTFKVAPGAGPLSQWSMDEGAGTTAADAVGGRNAALFGSATWSDHARLGKSVQGDGTSSYAATASPVLDTTKSFTASTWVRLTGNSHDSVALAQAGANGSAFALSYSAAANAWVFNRYASDVVAPTIVRSTSTALPVVGVWTHLMGVYDAQEQTIQLFVNGVPQGVPVSYTTPWQGTGGLQFARGQHGGGFSDYFAGQIDEVTVWNRILSEEEIADLQAMTDASTGQARPAPAAEWGIEETSGTTAADSSGYGHLATVAAGGTWATDADGGKGNVLSLAGTSTANATVTGPIVDSQGDFTVAAWADLDASALSDTSVAHHMRIATQSGGVRDSWGLWYDQAAGSTQGMWVFGRTTADTTGGSVVTVPADIASAQLVDPGHWTLVTGVYDGAHHQLFLYVNGVRQGAQGDTGTGDDTGDGIVFTQPWQATGTFNIGRGRTSTGAYSDYAQGLVDDVRVWTGVMSDTAIDQMYVNEVPIPL